MKMDYEALCETLLPDSPVNPETIEWVRVLLRFFNKHRDLPAFPQIAQPLIEHCDKAGLLVTVSNLEAVYRLHRTEFERAVDQVPSNAWRDYIRGFEAAQTATQRDDRGELFVGPRGRRVPIEQRAYSQAEIDEMSSSEYSERILGIRRINGQ